MTTETNTSPGRRERTRTSKWFHSNRRFHGYCPRLVVYHFVELARDLLKYSGNGTNSRNSGQVK